MAGIGSRPPAARGPGGCLEFANVTRRDKVSATSADNHLASPTMRNHYSDHLLSAYP